MTPSDLPPESFNPANLPPALRAASLVLAVAVIGIVLFQAVATAALIA